MPTASDPVQLRGYQQDAIAALASGRPGIMSVGSIATGGGKTVIAAGLAEPWLGAGADQHVLYLTPRVELVKQALATFGRFPALRGRVGSAVSSRVVVLTTQTWRQRLKSGGLPESLEPGSHLLVIVDECHWAVKAPTGQLVLDAYMPASHVVGLTATPVEEPSGRTEVVFEKSFADLVDDGFLARPRVVDIRTGHTWDPVVRRDRYAPESLRQLGAERVRNDVIVNELLRGRTQGSYGRALIFSCDIAHAVQLERMLAERGVAARAVHSRLSPRDRAATISDFAAGRTSVLVNVELLTHGIDIPEIDAVFLARPTRSEVLCAQMVGRGSRKTPGKTTFDVVVFNDNITRLGGAVFHPTGLLSVGARR